MLRHPHRGWPDGGGGKRRRNVRAARNVVSAVSGQLYFKHKISPFRAAEPLTAIVGVYILNLK
jgi:hypothetical protein